MEKHLARPFAALAALAGVLILTGCAAGYGPSGTAHYRCEHGVDFKVRFVDDTAVLDGANGSDLLFRDAGGQGPQQAVYANPRMRAEFGLGASGREAVLRYPLLPLTARCVRD
ncbi:hypothetical protein [Polaromonas aquatica]|uniref:hypothetical protein n=1 Tax=Polaromonas aquatica TaxID=332657 RepID=UPI003D65FA6C